MRIKFSKIGAVLLALMLMSTFALGQTAMVMPKQYFFDGNGDPLAGGKIYTYEPSTQIPKDTFTTEGGTTPNPNPVILNSEGYSAIYIEGSYAIKVTDSGDVTIWTADPVSSYVTDADLSPYVTGVALSDPTPGSGSDLVAHTGTADTVTEALAKKVAIAGDTMTGSLMLNDGTSTTPRIWFIDEDTGGADSVAVIDQQNETWQITSSYQGGGVLTPISFSLASGILRTLGNQVLTTADEGSGNGLDADTVDGQHASEFLDATEAIGGDGVAGRKLRASRLTIEDGTNISTLKVILDDIWNGDGLSQVDNLARGATSGGFTLSASGEILSFTTTGDALASLSADVIINTTIALIMPTAFDSSGDISVTVRLLGDDVLTTNDWTLLVDTTERFDLDILYVTDQ